LAPFRSLVVAWAEGALVDAVSRSAGEAALREKGRDVKNISPRWGRNHSRRARACGAATSRAEGGDFTEVSRKRYQCVAMTN